ncbi:hypothetical protein [Pseudidiomarina donghaiensis]|uniref:hypothetical protein n=1 Tax=Pseudidiomarina donghaiensis TaxID=519452 RepID=UPI000AA933CE|nr:hypothetical protein [Pseudidiomarina donghaiensis]
MSTVFFHGRITMPQPTFRSFSLVIIIALCLYLPLWESLAGGVLWRVHWHSPLMMDYISSYLRFIKLVMVLIGLYLFIAKQHLIATTIDHWLARKVFNCFGYLFGYTQLVVLTLGVFAMFIFPTNFQYVHRNQDVEGGTIYVYTADPGAMGTAYHYVYLQCTLPLNRYQLTYIAQLTWMRNFQIAVDNDDVVITDTNNPETVHRHPIPDYPCAL